MKTKSIATAIFVLASCVLQAEDSLSSQQKLLNLELELISAQAQGYGQNHPTILSLNSEIKTLEAQPDIRNDEYLKLAKAKIEILITERSQLKTSGLGTTHPARQAIEKKIAKLTKLQNQTQD